MEEQSITIFEERQGLMVSPTGDSMPVSRTAHFLKPTLPSIDGPGFQLPSLSLFTKPSTFTLKDLPVKVVFKGWRYPTKKWTTWVASLHCKYQSIWKQAGIYEAIMGSSYKIRVHNELVLWLAERWCTETNTFIFPWGEATITLEDMILSGGYSVLGDSVLVHLETKELLEIEETLIEACKAAATIGNSTASYKAWMDYFMNRGHELEHEAFLSMWLSRFVLPKPVSYQVIGKHVFPIAIHLARGIPIALAPAVLSSIYRDLGFLQKKLFGSTEVKNVDEVLNLYAPLQFVQIWAWERFPTLRPVPNDISYGEPRPALWHKVSNVNTGDVRLVIDSAGESFQWRWRPYARVVKNCLFPKFYGDKEQWISVDTHLDKAFESFARCLRVSELVGPGCVEQYNPHRVAMQFGMDQDIPDHVIRCNKTPEIAWSTYDKPIKDAKLYVPSQMFKPNVTSRYLKWWKQSVLGCQEASKSLKSSKSLPSSSKRKRSDNDASVPPGFAPKNSNLKSGDSVKKEVDDNILTIRELLRSSDKHNSVGNGMDSDGKSSLGPQNHSSSAAKSGVNIKTESAMEFVKKIVQGEAVSGGAGKAMEDGNGQKVQSRVCDTKNESENGGESGSNFTLEIPGWELEAKISKLERVVAELKAARFGFRFGENSSRKCF